MLIALDGLFLLLHCNTPAGNYGRIGSNSLVNQLGDMLQAQGHNPYLIPVGGSCALGAFGYIECVREIMAFAAAEDLHFDHIVTACGSGGTAAGLALGLRLAGLTGSPGVSGRTQLHCIGVCDSPQYFYEHIREVATTLGVDLAQHGEMETWCKIYDGQGIGYARSTVEELQFLADLSSSTGLLLDPVYSGKAFHFMMHKLLPTEVFRQGQRVLFLHTGGTLGLYDKETQLLPILKSKRQVGDLLSALNGDTST
ncbi:pyridoxal-phosphate dependent enzyme [archaeon]|nr:MAG: pyridoxal-phosphate dependent enzyme [archaeon]